MMTRPWREEIAEVLGSQRINCTGPGEVGCRGVQGWHSWGEHEKHQADAVLAKLADLLGSDEVELETAKAILDARRHRWDNVHQGECITDARAALDVTARLCGGEES